MPTTRGAGKRSFSSRAEGAGGAAELEHAPRRADDAVEQRRVHVVEVVGGVLSLDVEAGLPEVAARRRGGVGHAGVLLRKRDMTYPLKSVLWQRSFPLDGRPSSSWSCASRTIGASKGCAILQPYDMEVGAGTSHTATFLRSLGPEPWRAAYVQPSRRPKDGRYGENPNRLQHYYQFQVVLKPSPPDILELYLGSLEAVGFDLKKNDVRFVEDDWENPDAGRLGPGLGSVDERHGDHAVHLLPAGRRPRLQADHRRDHLRPRAPRDVPAGRGERLRPRVDRVGGDGATRRLTYRDVYHQNEVEQSTYNFEHSDAATLFRHFGDYEAAAKRLMEAQLALPAYEQVLKAAHTFNLLDARGAISVTERAGLHRAHPQRSRRRSRRATTSRASAWASRCSRRAGGA